MVNLNLKKMSAYDLILEAMKKITDVLDSNKIQLTDNEQKDILDMYGTLGDILEKHFGK